MRNRMMDLGGRASPHKVRSALLAVLFVAWVVLAAWLQGVTQSEVSRFSIGQDGTPTYYWHYLGDWREAVLVYGLEVQWQNMPSVRTPDDVSRWRRAVLADLVLAIATAPLVYLVRLRLPAEATVAVIPLEGDALC